METFVVGQTVHDTSAQNSWNTNLIDHLGYEFRTSKLGFTMSFRNLIRKLYGVRNDGPEA